MLSGFVLLGRFCDSIAMSAWHLQRHRWLRVCGELQELSVRILLSGRNLDSDHLSCCVLLQWNHINPAAMPWGIHLSNSDCNATSMPPGLLLPHVICDPDTMSSGNILSFKISSSYCLSPWILLCQYHPEPNKSGRFMSFVSSWFLWC